MRRHARAAQIRGEPARRTVRTIPSCALGHAPAHVQRTPGTSRRRSAKLAAIRRRSDDEFNALFAELSQRTYTLYCFTREADGKAEAAADETGARRSAAAIVRERSAVSIGQFIAEAAAVVGAHGR